MVRHWKWGGLWAAVAAASGFAYAGEHDPVYEWEGGVVRFQDLSPAARVTVSKIWHHSHSQMQRAIDDEFLHQALRKEADEKKITVAALQAERFAGVVSEADAKVWFEQNKLRLGGQPYEMIKSEIIGLLQQQRAELGRQEFLSKLKASQGYRIVLRPPPVLRVDIHTAESAAKGRSNAAVTVVEFGDYRCGHCKVAADNLRELVSRFPERVRFVFVDFPLAPTGVSADVARGAYCAQRQGKYWEFHYEAFARQSSLSPRSSVEIAQQLQLKMSPFQSCLGDPASEQAVMSARREGERIGVDATPAIFINGAPHLDGYEAEQLQAAINRELKL